MNRVLVLILLVSSLLVGVAAHRAAAQVGSATAELRNANGQAVARATLTQEASGVRIAIQARGLPPGRHGFHIHETGRCDPPDFTSAGGHFNPEGRQHGTQNPQGPHAGDLPNLDVTQDSTASATVTATRVTLAAGANSLLKLGGTALVIHADPDDERTDPTGNSGGRIACGVITAAQAAPATVPRTGMGGYGQRDMARVLSLVVIAGVIVLVGGALARWRLRRVR